MSGSFRPHELLQDYDGELFDVEWYLLQWSKLQDIYFADDGELVDDQSYDGGSDDEEPRDAGVEFRRQRSAVKKRWDWETVARADEHQRQGTLRQLVMGVIPTGKLDQSTDIAQLHELERAWSNITPQEFVMTLAALAPSETQWEYLSCLAVPVDRALFPRSKWKHERGHSVLLAATTSSWSSSPGSSLPHFDVRRPALAPPVWIGARHVFDCCERRGTEFNYRFGYTTAVRLFNVKDTVGQTYIVKALLASECERGVHVSLVGRAILVNTWINARDGFYRERCLDIVHLMCLSAVGVKLRVGSGPDMMIVAMLAFVSARALGKCVLELLTNLRLFGRPFVFGTSFALFILEYSSAIAIWWVLWPARHHINRPCMPGSCPVYDSLGLFSISILLKWGHFISSMLCVRTIGTRVLPAFYTIISAESTRFLSVISICIFAAFSAYYVFPVEDTQSALLGEQMAEAGRETALQLVLGSLAKWQQVQGIPNNLLKMLVRMFQLSTTGEVDYLELEGKDPVLRINLTALNAERGAAVAVGTLDEAEPDPHFHQGVICLMVILSVLLNVILMNVYVGLLSSVYETFSSRQWELLAEFRALHALRYMTSTPSRVLRHCFGDRCCRRLTCEGVDDNAGNAAVWFAYRNDEFESGFNNQETAFAEIKRILREVQLLRVAADAPGNPRTAPTLPDFFS